MKVIVRDRLIPQVGAITMDQLMLDVSAIPDLETGEVVTLLGQVGKHQISAENWANTLGTISWEILCGFKNRLPRVAVQKLNQGELSVMSIDCAQADAFNTEFDCFL